MKLIIAIGHDHEQAKVAQSLVKAGIAFTKVGSTGGFLHQGSTTLLIGVEPDVVPRVMAILKTCCHKEEHLVASAPVPIPGMSVSSVPSDPVMVEEGGGIAFVVDVDQVERF
jgi:uncharacterized protein YaaQ